MSTTIDPTVDHYRVLGVKSDAKADEIKKAYRRLAKKYHPDSTGGDKAKEAKFKEVSTAYDVLGNPNKRAEYDTLRAGGGAFGGLPGGAAGAGAAGFDLGDLFSQVFTGFGGRGGTTGPGGGRVRYNVYRGGGAGDTPLSEAFGGGGFEPFGGGAPRGRRTGKRAAPKRAAPADKKVRASDGSMLIQRGADVHSDVRLDFDKAVLGTVVSIPTLRGTASVKIPPGTSSGVKLRLKGKGAARGGGGHGDHFVTVHIRAPKLGDDEEAKRLLVQLMQRARKHGTKKD